MEYTLVVLRPAELDVQQKYALLDDRQKAYCDVYKGVVGKAREFRCRVRDMLRQAETQVARTLVQRLVRPFLPDDVGYIHRYQTAADSHVYEHRRRAGEVSDLVQGRPGLGKRPRGSGSAWTAGDWQGWSWGSGWRSSGSGGW